MQQPRWSPTAQSSPSLKSSQEQTCLGPCGKRSSAISRGYSSLIQNAANHYLFAGVPSKFIVTNFRDWLPHPVLLKKAANVLILAESDTAPQIIEIDGAVLATFFPLRVKHLESVRILTNYLHRMIGKIRFEDNQNSSILQTIPPLKEPEIRMHANEMNIMAFEDFNKRIEEGIGKYDNLTFMSKMKPKFDFFVHSGLVCKRERKIKENNSIFKIKQNDSSFVSCVDPVFRTSKMRYKATNEHQRIIKRLLNKVMNNQDLQRSKSLKRDSRTPVEESVENIDLTDMMKEGVSVAEEGSSWVKAEEYKSKSSRSKKQSTRGEQSLLEEYYVSAHKEG